MSEITIQIPSLREVKQMIEIEVKVNGERKRFNYRVETFKWEEAVEPENRIDNLKKLIKDYDKEWRLIQIGNPYEDLIPIMFRQKL